MFVSYRIIVKMINKSKDDLWNLSKSILQGIFIRLNSDHCIALSLSHFLLLLNFAQIVGFVKVDTWISLLGVVHISRNHFWGSRESPPPCNIVIIWASPPLCNIVIIWTYPPYVIL